MKNLTVSISINTIYEKFRSDMDNACTSNERLDILKILHDNGIYTILFMSPFFPYITDWMELIDISCSYVDEY